MKLYYVFCILVGLASSLSYASSVDEDAVEIPPRTHFVSSDEIEGANEALGHFINKEWEKEFLASPDCVGELIPDLSGIVVGFLRDPERIIGIAFYFMEQDNIKPEDRELAKVVLKRILGDGGLYSSDRLKVAQCLLKNGSEEDKSVAEECLRKIMLNETALPSKRLKSAAVLIKNSRRLRQESRDFFQNFLAAPHSEKEILSMLSFLKCFFLPKLEQEEKDRTLSFCRRVMQQTRPLSALKAAQLIMEKEIYSQNDRKIAGEIFGKVASNKRQLSRFRVVRCLLMYGSDSVKTLIKKNLCERLLKKNLCERKEEVPLLDYLRIARLLIRRNLEPENQIFMDTLKKVVLDEEIAPGERLMIVDELMESQEIEEEENLLRSICRKIMLDETVPPSDRLKAIDLLKMKGSEESEESEESEGVLKSIKSDKTICLTYRLEAAEELQEEEELELEILRDVLSNKRARPEDRLKASCKILERLDTATKEDREAAKEIYRNALLAWK